jgi:hypothetical protein
MNRLAYASERFQPLPACKMAKRILFILGGLWLVLSGACLFWYDYALSHNAAAVACGYPDTGTKAYSDCMAAYLPKVDAAMWRWFLTDHLVWIVGPTIVFVAIGFLVRKRV